MSITIIITIIVAVHLRVHDLDGGHGVEEAELRAPDILYYTIIYYNIL